MSGQRRVALFMHESHRDASCTALGRRREQKLQKEDTDWRCSGDAETLLTNSVSR